ncbi:MAG: hypothetical protein EZS28_037826 [Streblomastix strix]|uniref:Uncharacterized protein n=1 Tax=Streblomastix strix TaxID=222440 RepID=A0A5J4U8H6_9EUKA|nr:MAG: hypothetical protein EZS28_037826 [Streblomastix strix]
MNQTQALKNLMEKGTSIEYFNDGYITKAKDKIKVYEEGKKSAKILSQAQQTKLQLQARSGGQTKPKRSTNRQIESDFDDADDESSLNDRKFQYSRRDQADVSAQGEQLYSDDEENDQTIVEKLVKTPKPTSQKTIKKPQINYTSPQINLEELILDENGRQWILLDYYYGIYLNFNVKDWGYFQYEKENFFYQQAD